MVEKSKGLGTGIGLALLSYALMKFMYMVDPLGEESGFLTAFVFIFVNFPMWLLSAIMTLYGLFLWGKESRQTHKKQAE
jgi:hypothetical protein